PHVIELAELTERVGLDLACTSDHRFRPMWAEQLAELTLTEGTSGYILYLVDSADDIRRFAAEVAPAVRPIVAAERARGSRWAQVAGVFQEPEGGRSGHTASIYGLRWTPRFSDGTARAPSCG